MKAIEAEYFGEVDRKDGRAYCRCPLCGRIEFEADIEDYHSEADGRKIECCTNCREDFERDGDVSLDSDTPNAETFVRMWQWAREGERR